MAHYAQRDKEFDLFLDRLSKAMDEDNASNNRVDQATKIACNELQKRFIQHPNSNFETIIPKIVNYETYIKVVHSVTRTFVNSHSFGEAVLHRDKNQAWIAVNYYDVDGTYKADWVTIPNSEPYWLINEALQLIYNGPIPEGTTIYYPHIENATINENGQIVYKNQIDPTSNTANKTSSSSNNSALSFTKADLIDLKEVSKKEIKYTSKIETVYSAKLKLPNGVVTRVQITGTKTKITHKKTLFRQASTEWEVSVNLTLCDMLTANPNHALQTVAPTLEKAIEKMIVTYNLTKRNVDLFQSNKNQKSFNFPFSFEQICSAKMSQLDESKSDFYKGYLILPNGDSVSVQLRKYFKGKYALYHGTVKDEYFELTLAQKLPETFGSTSIQECFNKAFAHYLEQKKLETAMKKIVDNRKSLDFKASDMIRVNVDIDYINGPTIYGYVYSENREKFHVICRHLYETHSNDCSFSIYDNIGNQYYGFSNTEEKAIELALKEYHLVPNDNKPRESRHTNKGTPFWL
jgi:hypothetical protein